MLNFSEKLIFIFISKFFCIFFIKLNDLLIITFFLISFSY